MDKRGDEENIEKLDIPIDVDDQKNNQYFYSGINELQDKQQKQQEHVHLIQHNPTITPTLQPNNIQPNNIQPHIISSPTITSHQLHPLHIHHPTFTLTNNQYQYIQPPLQNGQPPQIVYIVDPRTAVHQYQDHPKYLHERTEWERGEKERRESLIILVLGFFVCCAWAFGFSYRNSSNRSAKIMGRVSLALFLLTIIGLCVLLPLAIIFLKGINTYNYDSSDYYNSDY